MSNVRQAPAPGWYGPGSMYSDVSPVILRLLGRTAPWVTFLSVLGFIGSGLTLVGGALLLGNRVAEKGFESVHVGFALLYVVQSVFYAIPSLYLFRYAASIRDLRSGGGELALIKALHHENSFWRFVGIGIIVIFTLVLFVFAGTWFLWATPF